jgi:hypothetical protein
MFIAISTVIVLMLFVGLLFRHNRKIHVPLMSLAFGADVILVLAIELNRQAIEKATTHLDDGLLMFHVSVSLLTLILYTALTVLGVKLLKGKTEALTWHRRLAPWFLFCRLANYVTSFWVISV